MDGVWDPKPSPGRRPVGFRGTTPVVPAEPVTCVPSNVTAISALAAERPREAGTAFEQMRPWSEVRACPSSIVSLETPL